MTTTTVAGTGTVSGVLRGLLAAAVLVSAVVHLELWANEGFKDIDVVGPAFLVNAVAGLVIAIAVLVWRHWIPLLLAVGFGAATLGAFLLSTTDSGFFDVHEEWKGWAIWAAAISEIAAIVLGALALLVERRRPTAA